MDGQPIAAMAGVTVTRSSCGEAYQHTATSRVMTEVTVATMDCGRGDSVTRMASLARIVGCGIDHTAVVDIAMALEVVGTVAGITRIEGIGLRHGFANSTANQGDGGSGRGVAGLAAVMTLGISSAGGKCRGVTVNCTGGQHNRSWLPGIFVSADITGLVVIAMGGMTIQTGNRMLGIGLSDDLGNRGIGGADIRRATGVVAESAIALMLDRNIVPGGKVTVTGIMTNGTGLTRIGVSAKTHGMSLIAAARAVIVAGKIAGMTGDALAIRGSGAGG